jgi:hypothetical protein
LAQVVEHLPGKCEAQSKLHCCPLQKPQKPLLQRTQIASHLAPVLEGVSGMLEDTGGWARKRWRQDLLGGCGQQ